MSHDSRRPYDATIPDRHAGKHNAAKADIDIVSNGDGSRPFQVGHLLAKYQCAAIMGNELTPAVT